MEAGGDLAKRSEVVVLSDQVLPWMMEFFLLSTLEVLNTSLCPNLLQAVTAFLPHFLSAFKSLLQTRRALGLVEVLPSDFVNTATSLSSLLRYG